MQISPSHAQPQFPEHSSNFLSTSLELSFFAAAEMRINILHPFHKIKGQFSSYLKKKDYHPPYTLSITCILNVEIAQVVPVMKAKYNNTFNYKFNMVKSTVDRQDQMYCKTLRQQ